MSILLAIIILFFCFKKPVIGLVLLLQTNIIRAISEIDYSDPCFVCANDPDIILGAVTPILGFSLMIIKLGLKKPVKYIFDEYDGFFISAIVILFVCSIYSPNILGGLAYSFKFLFIGSSYFFMAKIVLINTEDYKRSLNLFFKYTFILSLVLGTLALVLFFLKEGVVLRLTIPGVHAIIFSQLIGFGILISFLIFITSGEFLKVRSKKQMNVNKIILLYLMLILFATNTRGVMLSVFVAIVFYLVVSEAKISKTTLYISGSVMLIAIIVVISYIDVEVLFRRALSPYTAQSGQERYLAYTQSFSMFFENIFGVGTDGFKYFSSLPYPHNLFLENMAQYGIFGILLNIYLLLMGILMLLKTLKYRKQDNMFVFIYALFIFFAVETMFSFTFWMHKGLYLMIGIFAAYYYRLRKKQKIQLSKSDNG